MFAGLETWPNLSVAFAKIATIPLLKVAASTLIVFEIFRAYSCKSTKPFGNLFSNKWMHLAALLSLGLHLLILYTPLHVAFKTVGLTLGDWLLVLMFSFIGYSLIELSKVFVKQQRQNQ